MTVKKQISDYITYQPEAKRIDMEALHQQIVKALPNCRLWFLDGKDSNNKTVSNPNIGYGLYMIRYADGSEKPFYQVGLSANTSGISVYIIGLKDKDYLPNTYGKKIGKASVTAYCIKFKSLKDIDSKVLLKAIKDGVKATS